MKTLGRHAWWCVGLLLAGQTADSLAARGTHLPDLSFHDLAGKTARLSSLRGHVAVVNFWATWCGPCREELPRLSQLMESYAPRGVEFVAISLDTKKQQAAIPRALEEGRVHVPVWVGADDGTLDRLELGNVLPATVIVNADGMVITRIEGEAREEDIRSAVDWALGVRAGAAPPPVLHRD